MAAMFMKNKVLSWASLFLAVQSYLNEPVNKPEADAKEQQQPAFFRILFAFVAIGTCYMDLFFPGTNPALKRAAKVASDATATATAVVTAA
ncbi:conserved hypothetical protein [Lodderomyces elongisporus NRRL YB-4239]|uniref:Uncharacterized protein n=2 Tax=Lodderomyces elongisporus TaxID=36914 RepID=A5E530_LODEL|nr:conserved hypothetical protein [Lodderomyces elongisporus NRRL YB-4239]